MYMGWYLDHFRQIFQPSPAPISTLCATYGGKKCQFLLGVHASKGKPFPNSNQFWDFSESCKSSDFGEYGYSCEPSESEEAGESHKSGDPCEYYESCDSSDFNDSGDSGESCDSGEFDDFGE